ncbi:MAG: hypothetical protein RLZZ596_1835 [Pseudomonadota bacterium]
MLIEFGKASLLEKARQQPEKVRMVIDKIASDGVITTIESVFSKLDKPLPLGYCNVGRVAKIGSGNTAFKLNDRVISNGRHADAVCVPFNLCAKVPDSVSDDEAAFTVLGAIALQGVRLVQPSLGEAVVVTGLGLIGLLTVQLLLANGCRVLGLDFDPDKLTLAKSFGAEVVDLSGGQDPLVVAQTFSRGRGVDAVIITASTRSNEPVHQAALMSRKRGRIVLVGIAGLEISRSDFYEKELSFQVSCAYGPGRYDPMYEDRGVDYPIGFVRWTAQRNFEAVLDMMADGRLNVSPLISHRYPIDQAEKAYELVGGSQPSLGILLEYPGAALTPDARTILLAPPSDKAGISCGKAVLSFVGSGNYATSVLIPAFKKTGAQLLSVASSNGVSGVHAGRKFGFEETTTDTDRLLSDPRPNAIVITTRHDSHARFVKQALLAEKHVFVEKPLCLTLEELADIQATYDSLRSGQMTPTMVMVGFNRRFAPHVKRMKTLLSDVPGPKSYIMTVNAGAIPSGHWTQDREIGGGRIVGEACHFIDLLRFLTGVPISTWQHQSLNSVTHDTTTLLLSFADGSTGTIHYFANGNKAFPKERLEVFASGRILQLDNFRKLIGYGWTGFSAMNLWRQDKGQQACATAFVAAIEGKGPAPIPFEEIIEVSRVTIEIAEVTS